METIGKIFRLLRTEDKKQTLIVEHRVLLGVEPGLMGSEPKSGNDYTTRPTCHPRDLFWLECFIETDGKKITVSRHPLA